ncbi:hypothetical protein LJ707_20185 [Mucilaginibacter sp. UR6-1]|uniref:hypothetical protein n=1 Tax=Mucilaginibacter sp. UR6-1 TaxID=1435643 RepID=UPI001E288BF9|nr:hypothetical protein [Mucilaginibacter sp. UR6-1]MCC8411271.1 hypothetical protein [Mucilaginibacter sp. UR6-1]
MKLTYHKPLFTVITGFMLVITMAMSCKNTDNEVNSGKVELLSFGPAGVKHGEQIRFIGNNLKKVTEIDLPGATVSSSAFVEQSDELIVITVPQETEKGLVTLKSADGDVTSKTEIQFEVPVTITSVPATARAGDNITITGDFVNWVTSVQFSPDILVEDFVSKSLTQIVVKVPAEAATGTVVFYTGGTKPLVIESENELVITP